MYKVKLHGYELDVLGFELVLWIVAFWFFWDFQCLVDGLCFGHCLKKVKWSIAQWVMNYWAFEHDLEILVGWWWAASSEIQWLLRLLILLFILFQKGLDLFVLWS